MVRSWICGAAARLLLLTPAPCFGAPGVWTGQMLTADLGPRSPVGPKLWLDLHQRQTGGATSFIVRPAAGWSVSRALSLWVGTAWVPTQDEDGVRHEHRPWQQAILQKRVGVIPVSARARFEQRFRQGATGVGARVRLMGRIGIPIGETGVGVVVWDEIFVGMNTFDGASPGVQANRLFVGPYLNGRKRVRFEPGYLLIITPSRPITTHHVAAVNLFVSIQTREKSASADSLGG